MRGFFTFGQVVRILNSILKARYRRIIGVLTGQLPTGILLELLTGTYAIQVRWASPRVAFVIFSKHPFLEFCAWVRSADRHHFAVLACTIAL